MAEPTKAQIAWLAHAKAYSQAIIEEEERKRFCRKRLLTFRRCRHLPLGRQVLAEAREREGRDGR